MTALHPRWAADSANSCISDVENALGILTNLNVLQKQAEHYNLEKTFASSLRQALTGGGNHNSFGVPYTTTGAKDVTPDYLDKFAREAWERILYYIVGSADTSQKNVVLPEGVRALLLQGELVESRGKTDHITPQGFNFILQDVNTQIWALLLVYLRNAEALNLVQSEMLSLLFTLGSMEVGQDYSTGTLTSTQLQMLEDLKDIGLVYRKSKGGQKESRYWPTRLATTLNSDYNALAAFSADPNEGTAEKGFIVVETNFRIYAYTDNVLVTQILMLFADITTMLPNLIAGRMSKRSAQRAFARGITAQQIIDYLTAYAHPIMGSNPRNTNPPQGHQQVQSKASLPPTVVDQILLWQIEGDRMKITVGVLLENYPERDNFPGRANFEDDCNFAEAVGVLAWKDDATRRLFISQPNPTQVSAHVQARQKDQGIALFKQYRKAELPAHLQDRTDRP